MSETPQGYQGPLPAYYIQSTTPQTVNLGLTLTGIDPILAYNLVLIDTAVGSGGGGGAPGGNVGDVQFKVDASTFGGSDNLFWDNTAQNLAITSNAEALFLGIDNGGSNTSLIGTDTEITVSGSGASLFSVTALDASILVQAGNTVSNVKGINLSASTAGGGALVSNYVALSIASIGGGFTNAFGIRIGDFSNSSDPTSRAFVALGGIVEVAGQYLLSGTQIDATDHTKQVSFNLSNIATGTTRTVNFPNANTSTAQANAGGAGLALASFSATTGAFTTVSVGSGTVTSVGLATGAGASDVLYTITGSPVTTSGTITETLRTQTANLVFAGPTTGAAASPTFRALVTADMPAGTGTVTSFSAGTLSPLFTTSVATATTTPALSFSLSNAGGGTVFGNNTTGSAAPAYTTAPVLGIPGTSTGTIALASSTASGKYTITAPANAATPTLTLPTGTGTFAVTASAPIVLDATTGNLTGPTIVTSAASLTSNSVVLGSGSQASKTVAGFTTDGTSQLTLGVATSTTGALKLTGATSGTATITAQATQSTPTLTLPTGTGTFAVTASAPIVLDATTGALTAPTAVTSAASLTSNAIVLGAGSQASKTAAGFTTNGTATMTIGAASTGTGTLTLAGTTSGTASLSTAATGLIFNSDSGLAFTGASGAATTISTTTTNANLILTPNGTGTVVIPIGSTTANGITFTGLTTGLFGVSTAIRAQLSSTNTSSFDYYIGTTQAATFSCTAAANGQQNLKCGTNSQGLKFSGNNNLAASIVNPIQLDNGGISIVANTSITVTGVQIGTNTFAPTSGAANYVGASVLSTINQTSTSSGNYTGILVNTTETALKGSDNRLLDLQAGVSGGTSQFTITNGGVVKTYAATATVGQGVPSEIVTIDLTAQSAAIAATNLTASAPRTGMYRISMSATITTAGTTSVLGGTNGFQIGFTSPTDSVAKTTVVGNSITSAANTTGTAISDTVTVYAKTGTAITYAFDYTSTGTAMNYELHVRLESM